jgi:nitroreductase family protein
LTAALKLRRSTREYSDRPLPPQVLSDLLWAAFGVNRPAIDGRTVPYWRHVMVIDVYDGRWRLALRAEDPQAATTHEGRSSRTDGASGFCRNRASKPCLCRPWRAYDGRYSRRGRLYACADASFIGQNVYLSCASEGLATVFRGVDDPKLGQHLRLPDQQFVTFAQTVGYPRG